VAQGEGPEFKLQYHTHKKSFFFGEKVLVKMYFSMFEINLKEISPLIIRLNNIGK
jgi:hypothetical protein